MRVTHAGSLRVHLGAGKGRSGCKGGIMGFDDLRRHLLDARGGSTRAPVAHRGGAGGGAGVQLGSRGGTELLPRARCGDDGGGADGHDRRILGAHAVARCAHAAAPAAAAIVLAQMHWLVRSGADDGVKRVDPVGRSAVLQASRERVPKANDGGKARRSRDQ